MCWEVYIRFTQKVKEVLFLYPQPSKHTFINQTLHISPVSVTTAHSLEFCSWTVALTELTPLPLFPLPLHSFCKVTSSSYGESLSLIRNSGSYFLEEKLVSILTRGHARMFGTSLFSIMSLISVKDRINMSLIKCSRDHNTVGIPFFIISEQILVVDWICKIYT